MGLIATDSLENDIRADTTGPGHNFVDWIVDCRIDRIETAVGRDIEFFGVDIDDEHLVGPLRERKLGTLIAHNAGSDHRDDVAGLNPAVANTEHRTRKRLKRGDLRIRKGVRHPTQGLGG